MITALIAYGLLSIGIAFAGLYAIRIWDMTQPEPSIDEILEHNRLLDEQARIESLRRIGIDEELHDVDLI
jgi:hypothetical protein